MKCYPMNNYEMILYIRMGKMPVYHTHLFMFTMYLNARYYGTLLNICSLFTSLEYQFLGLKTLTIRF